MGTEDRLAMAFDTVFWPEHHHFLRPLDGPFIFANMHAMGKPKILVAWVRPKHIDHYEGLSDAEAVKLACGILRKMFKKAFRPPIATKRTRWLADPYSRGSYSYVPPGVSEKQYLIVGAPVSGDRELDAALERGASPLDPRVRLHFAGEAAAKSDNYTVTGAYISGRSTAESIAEWWRARRSGPDYGIRPATERERSAVSEVRQRRLDERRVRMASEEDPDHPEGPDPSGRRKRRKATAADPDQSPELPHGPEPGHGTEQDPQDDEDDAVA
eukprot:TRINITY_DN973_c0_g1_i1.p2 TRINITY_DN973_c0_g1~~TRINITY_DN973_c0_g1_i1.p2  ORF type:complete len:271 (+),score=77.09 TRINITY_DN973_c0_g1_i1:1025-1837(+)